MPAAINSVLAQSRPDWELIIVDDGSTDDTREVVQPYTKDARIRYHHQENRELNGARNTGVRLAKGTYCCFLDDDDNYTNNHLEALSRAIGATGGCHGIYRTNMRIIGAGVNQTSPPFDNDEDALIQLWRTPRNLLPLAIRRDLLVSQPFDENDLLIDDFIWLNTALTKTSLFQTAAETTNYVQHATNRSKLYHSVELLAKITDRLHQAYRVPGVRERVEESLLKRRVQHEHMHLARQLGRNRARRKALKIWWQGTSLAGASAVKNTLKTLVVIMIG